MVKCFTNKQTKQIVCEDSKGIKGKFKKSKIGTGKKKRTRRTKAQVKEAKAMEQEDKKAVRRRASKATKAKAKLKAKAKPKAKRKSGSMKKLTAGQSVLFTQRNVMGKVGQFVITKAEKEKRMKAIRRNLESYKTRVYVFTGRLQDKYGLYNGVHRGVERTIKEEKVKGKPNSKALVAPVVKAFLKKARQMKKKLLEIFRPNIPSHPPNEKYMMDIDDERRKLDEVIELLERYVKYYKSQGASFSGKVDMKKLLEPRSFRYIGPLGEFNM